jgi:iron complex outermembrane receptor protein
MALATVLVLASAPVCRADQAAGVRFDLPQGSLVGALQRFSEQSGLQLVYEQAVVASKTTAQLKGRFTTAIALDRLLRGTHLQWHFINAGTVAIARAQGPVEPAARAAAPIRPHAAQGDVVEMTDIDIFADRRWLANTISNSAFGFNKALLETPRSISFVGEEAIDAFGLSAVEDLARIAPGVFTTTRFGIQGSVDVRNVPADTYFRGMKRLTLQGHGRSVLAALDSIEVVGGPPSPLYGMGKIGGYTNVMPKSGRAQSGRYMPQTQGYVQAIGGQYDRREVSFGVGGPLNVLQDRGSQGGYYLYGLVENSNSYAESVPVRQQLFQAAADIDDFVGRFRLETGINYQNSRTAGALIGRLDQELVDSGRYVSGAPLANLDLDGNGSIDYLETQTASPVRGTLAAGNQPLTQTWAWPRDSSGTPLRFDAFPKIAGIPQTMYDYLVAHPEADPTGLLRQQGVGGPLPISGAVPLGLALDPRTVHYSALDPRHSSAFERLSEAQFVTAYVDLIRDLDPDLTIKNQLFYDSMVQHKLSDQPFNQLQNVHVLEDKLTLTRRINGLPTWLRINSLFSLNLRDTVSSGRTTANDYGNHRSDAMAATWNETPGGLTANSTFHGSSFPWVSIYRTEFSELGSGALLDIDLPRDVNILLGGRFDASHARNTDFPGRFDGNIGTSAQPGAYLSSTDTAAAWDSGTSWTISVSRTLPHGLHPYLTLARSSIMLDGNNNSLSNATILAGHVGVAKLKEAGVKASVLNDSLLMSFSYYDQGRTEVSEGDNSALLSAYASATTTHGWQSEIRWAPFRNLLFSFYALHQQTNYTPNVGGVMQVDAAHLGFMDVVDARGNVVYPASAFLYGGRVRLILPDDLTEYSKKQGNPDEQAALSAIYQRSNGLGFVFKGNYLSSTCSGRLCLVRLPSSVVFDAGVFMELPRWNVKLDVFNLTNRHYFRARTGDTLGDVIAQAMPGRRWQITAKYKF